MQVRKAIIPVAGLGTRLFPATKAVPKELLPVCGKPVIQYIVEDVVKAGITEICFITFEGKSAIRTHFEMPRAQEEELARKERHDAIANLRSIADQANFTWVRQPALKGLGDAVRCGQDFVGDDPFAVVLGDNILRSTTSEPVLGQLLEIYKRYCAPVVAVQQIDPKIVSRYGIMDGQETAEARLFEVRAWVEKPTPENAPSRMAVAGAYIFEPKIFEILAATKPGVKNEIQLTDAMDTWARHHPMFAWQIQGTRLDIGNTLDHIKANVLLGLENERVGLEFERWLKTILGKPT